MNIFKKFTLISGICILCGCGLSPVEAGFGGAAVGAGTGAAIGSAMASGDVAASAGLGAAIGFPAGIVLALAVDGLMSQSGSSKKDNTAEINSNQHKISENNAEIEKLRHDVNQESPTGNPSEFHREKIFTGTTLANPYR